MRVLLQDLGYAFRQLRKTPGYTITALLTLALGIGATTAVFSALHGYLLRPLPYPEGDRLVNVFARIVEPADASLGGQHRLEWHQHQRELGVADDADHVGRAAVGQVQLHADATRITIAVGNGRVTAAVREPHVRPNGFTLEVDGA